MNPSDTPVPAIPRHVAIVMDGNGRWASRRGLPRSVGHKQGADALARAVRLFADRGVQVLTVYAFSTENWRRPQDEVSALMSLVPSAMRMYLSGLAKAGVRIRVVGDLESVPPKVRQAWRRMEEETASNTRLQLVVAFNYGGRWDIAQACRRAIESGLKPEELSEDTIGRHTALADLPAPDLLIRTGGEARLSNFLLWQLAYAELFFTDCLWPDFDAPVVDAALDFYASRERRFGALGAEAERGADALPATVAAHG